MHTNNTCRPNGKHKSNFAQQRGGKVNVRNQEWQQQKAKTSKFPESNSTPIKSTHHDHGSNRPMLQQLCSQRTTANWPQNHYNRTDSNQDFRMLRNYCAMIHSLSFGWGSSSGNLWRRHWTSYCLHMNSIVALMVELMMYVWYRRFRRDRSRSLRLCLSCIVAAFVNGVVFVMQLIRYRLPIHFL